MVYILLCKEGTKNTGPEELVPKDSEDGGYAGSCLGWMQAMGEEIIRARRSG
jgi:hypothetical protein